MKIEDLKLKINAITDNRRSLIIKTLGEEEMTAKELNERIMLKISIPYLSNQLSYLIKIGLIFQKNNGERGRIYKVNVELIDRIMSKIEDI